MTTLAGVSHANEGPGILSKIFKKEELFVPMGQIESSSKGLRGHAAMQLFKGYLAGVEGRDSGGGDAAIVFFDISDPQNPKRVLTHIDEHTNCLLYTSPSPRDRG